MLFWLLKLFFLVVVGCCSVLPFFEKNLKRCLVFFIGHGLSWAIFGCVGLLLAISRLFVKFQVLLG